MKSINWDFNFKKVAAKEISTELLESPQFSEFFEVAETRPDGKDSEGRDILVPVAYKRKKVQAVLSLPDFVGSLVEADQQVVADILGNTIAAYVRQKYVDNFEPVGAHTWEDVKAWLNSRGRSVKYDFDDATFKRACEHFAAYCENVFANSVIAKRVTNAAKQKFTKSAIASQINSMEPEVLRKLLARVNDWAEYLVNQDADLAEDFEPVYSAWKAAIDGHITDNTTIVDVAAAL